MDPTSKSGVAERSEPEAADIMVEQMNRPNPWRAFAGIWLENPDFDAFLAQIQDLRRETDEAEN